MILNRLIVAVEYYLLKSHHISLGSYYRLSYLHDFDKPLCVIKDEPEYTKKVFKQNVLKVKPRMKAKMPFVARFVSVNTCDRIGSLKGLTLEIISLSEVKVEDMMFT